MEKQKRRRGDRRDGRLLRELDSLHFITGIIYPNRCDNEAYISERIDLTPVKEYIARRNETETDFPYTYFHLVLTALVKTITLRPKMNRFIVNGNFFQRNEVTASFVVKKQFSDKGAEALAMLHTTGDDTIDTVHEYIRQQVTECRSDKVDSTTGEMDILNKLPRWVGKTAVRFIMWLDKHGWVPDSMTCNDPYYSSVVLSNLGSIGLECGYHHLVNWGTNSCFVIIGKKHMKMDYLPDGTPDFHEVIPIGITLDERIADGYYYSGTVALVKELLTHPELLEAPADTPVEYAIKR